MINSLDTPAVLLAIPLVWGLVVVELAGGLEAVMSGSWISQLLLVIVGALMVPFLWLVIVRLLEIAANAGVV